MKQTTVYILLLLLTACQSKDRLDMALEYAGDNRKELEKVLEHYRGDEMKYRAARFLIENMVGHTGHDSTDVRKFQPFYDRHVAISKKYNWERPAEWQQEIDSIWKESGQSLFFPKSRKDVQTMRADRLIQEIDRSFKAWQENAYTRNAPFEDFCRYILPYRYAEGVCIKKSAHTPLYIIGGSDVIPMPDFYASIGHDIKTIEDSDLLYCFPVDYAWKKVSIKDAIFNVARLPLDFVGRGKIDSTVQQDLGNYFSRTLESLCNGIPFTYSMMTANSGKTDRNDWTWTSADVISKLPQQQLDNDGVLTKGNMFLCPSLDVLGEEYISNENVDKYKKHLERTDMLFINLHGSHNKAISGYFGVENHTAYWGMTTELIKQLRVPVINAFPCYGARYGLYYFDNNDGSVPDYEVYDREDSMLLTAFYNSDVLLFTGSCTCSMCSNVIGSGSATDHINDSTNAIDLLMPAGYAEAMLKLYACHLIQGEPAGYAFLHAKIDYLNYRAKYENKDLVFLTLNQFNLFGCPTIYLNPQTATRQLLDSVKSFHVESKELPDVNYKTVFDRFEQGIDGVLNRVRTLVDNNLKAIDKKIRKQLYGSLGLTEDNLIRIESVEYNGQQSYNLTYSKKNFLYPEFFVVQTDKQGTIKEVLESR